MTDVFNEFFDKLTPILLNDLLSQFQWCVQQENDQLSKSAVSCLENLVLTNRPKMDLETEHTVLRFLTEIITCTLIPTAQSHIEEFLPRQKTVSIPPLTPNSTSIKSMKHRIQVHLEIIASIRRMIFGVSMKEIDKAESIKNGLQSLVSNDCFQDILDLVNCLLFSHKVARSFLIEKSKSSPSHISSEATLIPLGKKRTNVYNSRTVSEMSKSYCQKLNIQ